MGIRNAWRELWRPNPSVMKTTKRSFTGGEVNRLTAGWTTSVSSADTEIKGDIKRLRERSRDLIRNVDYCKNAIRAITDNVVGTSVRLQAQIRQQRGGKLNQRLNDQVETAFKKWGHADSCDVSGKLSFDDICRNAVNAWASDGECFIRLIRGRKFGSSDTPLALQLLESDMVDEDYQGKAPKKGWEWRMGVLVDEWHRPRQYAFFSRHPGDTLFINQPTAERNHIFVEAKDVIHLAKFDRPGQTRGIPWLSSSIQRIHHLQGYEQSEIIARRVSSAQMAWITTPEGELSGDDVVDEERVYDMSPGSIRYLAPGEQIHVPNLDSPSGQFEPFVRAMIRALSAGIGVSYSTLSRDSSQTNYSSSRLDLLQDQESFKALQRQLREIVLEPVYKEWLELSVLGGSLNLPNYTTEPQRYQVARWMFKSFGWVDQMKECTANQLAVASGFKLQSQVLAEQGLDLEEFLTARKNEIELAESMGLSFETTTKGASNETTSKVEETSNTEVDDGEPTRPGEES